MEAGCMLTAFHLENHETVLGLLETSSCRAAGGLGSRDREE